MHPLRLLDIHSTNAHSTISYSQLSTFFTHTTPTTPTHCVKYALYTRRIYLLSSSPSNILAKRQAARRQPEAARWHPEAARWQPGRQQPRSSQVVAKQQPAKQCPSRQWQRGASQKVAKRCAKVLSSHKRKEEIYKINYIPLTIRMNTSPPITSTPCAPTSISAEQASLAVTGHLWPLGHLLAIGNCWLPLVATWQPLGRHLATSCPPLVAAWLVLATSGHLLATAGHLQVSWFP